MVLPVIVFECCALKSIMFSDPSITGLVHFFVYSFGGIMNFEQLTLDDLKTDFTLPFHYASLDNDQKVYCKLDWLTVMFFDCSMHDVLKWIHLENSVSDFCSSLYQVSRGYDDVFKFNFNNVMLETSSFNFYGENLDISIFNVVVPKIRLELSGTGLDYLRSIGVNMDSYRLVAPELPSGGHIILPELTGHMIS